MDSPSTNPLGRFLMGTLMEFTEKVDVLDLLINVLWEHEAKLDELVSRLEDSLSYMP